MGIGIGAEAKGFCLVGLRVIVTEGREILGFLGGEGVGSSRSESLRLREEGEAMLFLETSVFSLRGESGTCGGGEERIVVLREIVE